MAKMRKCEIVERLQTKLQQYQIIRETGENLQVRL